MRDRKIKLPNNHNPLKSRLATIPRNPGVYLFRDGKNRVIYVGKAKLLRNRVRSYFQKSTSHSPRIQQMIDRIREFETIITDSEIEALVLENTLIKEHRPRYNVRFKDDKQYLYIKITSQEPFPRLLTARRIENDGAQYFGPNTDSRAVRKTLKILREIFQLRTCNVNFLRKKCKRPCLDFFIKMCSAPCTGNLTESEYQETAYQAGLFLEGDQEILIERLRKKMWISSKNLEFEKATMIRDQMNSLKRIFARHRIVSADPFDQDFIGIANKQDIACIQLLYIRNGVLVGQRHYFLEGTADTANEKILAQFLIQYYQQDSFLSSRTGHIPVDIFLPHTITDKELIVEWLQSQKNNSVNLSQPIDNREDKIMNMAMKNAKITLESYLQQPETERRVTERALKELTAALNLTKPPFTIEAFDISTIQGVASVGSMVTFEDGKPNKTEYRRYKIREVFGMDDFAMMYEVVKRRYTRILSSEKSFPDLAVIDGGRGQLNAAIKALADLGIFDLPIIGIAKRFEEIYTQYQSEPIQLPKNSQGLFLLQRIRDEAHRFAITYHRLLRQKKSGVPSRKRSAH